MMREVVRACLAFSSYPVRYHVRWAHREHEDVITGDGLVLLKFRVHARDEEGWPTRLSVIRKLDLETATPEWRLFAAMHPDRTADYWGDPRWVAALSAEVGVADIREETVFALDAVARTVRRLLRGSAVAYSSIAAAPAPNRED